MHRDQREDLRGQRTDDHCARLRERALETMRVEGAFLGHGLVTPSGV